MILRAFLWIFFLQVSLFSQSMDEKIDALRSAPESEKSAMMDSLKSDIAKINEDERARAIDGMRQRFESRERGVDSFRKDFGQMGGRGGRGRGRGGGKR